VLPGPPAWLEVRALALLVGEGPGGDYRPGRQAGRAQMSALPLYLALCLVQQGCPVVAARQEPAVECQEGLRQARLAGPAGLGSAA
jgi:hypothetical protein